MVRGRGYIKSLSDVTNIPLMVNQQTGAPVLVRDVATVTYGPDMRRGVSEIDGKGEAGGGVVIMRFGENAQTVIERVKAKISETEPTVPKGLKIVPTYDRSDLIARSIDNLKLTLIEELIIVSLVILIFLWHFPSAIIPITAIPLTVILAFTPIQLSGMTANIMSLGGIAVAIGAMLVAAVVVVEQIHKKLEHWEAESRPGSRK
jgi:copper/silver efflux system protein